MSNSGKKFTENSLRQYDGKEGRPTYVAVNGTVYDVTGSKRWRNGAHMGAHIAGNNLTVKLENAPHEADVLARFPSVGTLVEEAAEPSFGQRLRKLAPHPMIIHFPIAYGTLIPVLSILYLLTGNASLEAASYYVLVFGFLAAPAGALSGYISWKVAYGSRGTRDFRQKITYSVGLLIAASLCVLWRTLNPAVLLDGGVYGFLYLGLQLCVAVFVGLLGHIGGKIVFS